MPAAYEHNFTRYLASKKTVDDRAINLRVWNTLTDQLAGRASKNSWQVLELGAGIGTMVERVVEWKLFPGDVVYTALDVWPENTREAYRRLPKWAARRGAGVEEAGEALILTKGNRRCDVRFLTADAFDYVGHEAGQQAFDLVIANAFLDIVNIPAAVQQLFKVLKPGGLFYFTITFDGVTIFEPIIDRDLDAQIEALYHADMDARRQNGLPTGGSRAGRSLLRHLAASDAHLLAAGASDWVIYPASTGYPADEAHFLHAIVHMVEQALTGHATLDPATFADWVERRHQQIEDAELIYIAHQLDVLGQLPK